MKKHLLFLIAFLTVTNIFAQEQQTEKKEKLKFTELPGAFVFDIGMTHYRFSDPSMRLKTLGSRGINIYYTYDIKLVGETFSFSPGIGLGLTNYSFDNPKTITYSSTTDSTKFVNIPASIKGLKKSKLNANYLDVPLEFRWKSSPDVNSFKITLGVKAGVLISSHTKIKYKDKGVKKIKEAGDFNLNRFRYGAYARVGYGAFALFGYYSLSELFEKNKAPFGNQIVPYTLGITISAF